MQPRLIFSVLFVLFFSFSNAQLTYVTTVPPLAGGNGSNGVGFNVKAYNNITVKSIWISCLATTGTYTVTVWYRTDSILHTSTTTPHPAISTANGWVQLATNVTIDPVVGGNGTLDSIQHVFSLAMPAGVTYGFFIEGTGFSRYTSFTSGNPVFSDGNIHINTGTGVGWAGSASGPSFHPRQFNGKIGYELSCAANVTAHPASKTVCAGSNTSFAVTGNGSVTTYQWQENQGSGFANLTNTGVYGGVTTNTLNITGATAGMNNYQYRCVVGNGTCSLQSNAATLTVGTTATSISSHPPDRTVCSGSNTTFGVTAAGSNLTYQWQVNAGLGYTNLSNTGVYSNVTTATMTITGATTGMNGNTYRCVVGGSCAPLSVTSNDGNLVVLALPAVSAHPPDRSICVGGGTTFGVTASGATAYRWQVDQGSGFNNLSNNSTYSGVTTATLTVSNITTGMNGYKYRCVVTGAGSCTVNSNAGTLTVNTPPSITAHPPARTICEGDGTNFTVTAGGTSLTYQWQENTGSGFTDISNGGVYSGTTSNNLVLSNVPAGMTGNSYRCRVSGTCTPMATSNGGSLTVNVAPLITGQPVDDTACEGDNITFAVTATGTGIGYQWEQDAGAGFTIISDGGKFSGTTTNTLSINNLASTFDDYKYRCVVSGTCSPDDESQIVTLRVNKLTKLITDVPDSIVTCDSMNVTIMTQFDGSGLTYQWQESISGGSYLDIPNFGIYSGANTDQLLLTAPGAVISGRDYRCRVQGACGAPVTTSPTRLIVNEFPRVITHPVDTSVIAFGVISFSITASGTDIKYQWQFMDPDDSTWQNLFDNYAHSGTKTNVLTITGTYLSKDAFQYRCIVSGICGKDDTSGAGMLTVIEPPNSIGQLTGDAAGITLYPNPVKNELVLKFENTAIKNARVNITDPAGRVVSEADINTSQQNTAILDVHGLPPGIYNIRVVNEDTKLYRVLRFTKE